MFRLSRQTKILSPALVHRRIWFRGFHDEFIPNGTGNDGTGNPGTGNDGTGNHGTGNHGTGNDGHGGRSDIFWDRINRLDDKIDGAIKDHSTFKVDVVKSIGKLSDELRQSINDGNTELRQSINDGNTGVHKEFAELKSDQKTMRWQLHCLFIGSSSLVIWTIKDYIQLRLPAYFASDKGTPPHEQLEAPQKKLQK